MGVITIDSSGTSLGVLSAGRIMIMVIGLFDCGGGPVGCSDWLSVHGAVVVCPGGVRIGYIRRALTESSSLDAAPVTGSLVFSAPVCCLAVYCAAGFFFFVGAKKRFCSTRPGSCSYCGTWIKCDMYRHVAKFHLDLAQLWRCPVSWYMVWKGTPQDCMDHVRGTHDVPWVIESASIKQFVPPWTVWRQV